MDGEISLGTGCQISVEDAIGSKVEQRGTEIGTLERRNTKGTNTTTPSDKGQRVGLGAHEVVNELRKKMGITHDS